jgi:hypothetical protein
MLLAPVEQVEHSTTDTEIEGLNQHQEKMANNKCWQNANLMKL